MPQSLSAARLFALFIPAALLAGAWTSQLVFGLAPCEMCHWQRWPHYAALLPALSAFIAPPATRPTLVAIATLLIAISGAIGAFHAGVEYGWWEGLTTCAAPSAASLEDILNAPLIRCDVAPWDLWGVSLAGFNAIFSLGGAALIFSLLRKSRTAQ